jgi:hypothetical protein
VATSIQRLGGPASLLAGVLWFLIWLHQQEALGGEHPNREAARRAFEEAVAAGESLCSDAEVLQEILRRYSATRRMESIDPAFDGLLAVVDVVYPIERTDVERARRLLKTTPRLAARDAIHIAVMQGR